MGRGQLNQVLLEIRAASYPSHYAFDTSTPKGKALLSLAEAALRSGKSVYVLGKNSCINTGSAQIEEVDTLSLSTN